MKTQTYKDALKQVNIYYSDDPDTARAARSYLSMCQDDKIKPSQALQLVYDRFGRKSSGKNPVAGVDTLKSSNLPRERSKSNQTGKTSANSPKSVKTSGNGLQNEILTAGASDLERVEDSGALDMVEIENRVDNAINDFCIRYEIDGAAGLKKSRQTTWSACCRYIGRHVFKETKILKATEKIDNGSCTVTTCARYDLQKMVDVLYLFEYECNLYDKALTYWAAAAFCGTDEKYILDNAEKLTQFGFPVLQKMEQSINDTILDGRASPVGAIATLNHRFKWSAPAETAPVQQKTVIVYPVLGSPAPTDATKLIDGNGNGINTGG